MVRTKHIILSTLILLCVLTFSGCGDPEKEITVYGRFQDAYTEDALDVNCEWDDIRVFLDNNDLTKYGLFQVDTSSAPDEYIEEFNRIRFTNYALGESDAKPADLGSCQASYGAIICNSVQSRHSIGEQFFTEPMVEIYLHNPDAFKGEAQLDYLLSYRAVYSLDGELALEEGQWFLDDDKDEFCRKYFETILKVIGKSN